MSIDYTKIDQNEVRDELINLLQQTPSFKNASFSGTVLYDLVNALSYISSLYGFYVNQIANEPFLDTAKQYKNINRLANTLNYRPIGKGSAKLSIASSLTKDYVLKNPEGFIEIPTYSQFPCVNNTSKGEPCIFVNEKPISIQIKQFGVHCLTHVDIEYVGEIIMNNKLQNNKILIRGQAKKPIQIIYQDVVYTFEDTIYSEPHASLLSFEVGIEYSLLVRKDITIGFALVIKPKTVEVDDNEIVRFVVNSDRSITIVQNFSLKKMYLGRTGFNNLNNVIFQTIPLYSKPTSVGKINMIIPRYSSAFEVLSKGEVYSFSSKTEDVIISTGDIEDAYFKDGKDVFILLKINDVSKKWYNASLILKKQTELEKNDTIIGYIPFNSENFDNGNLKSFTNTFLGTNKQGVVSFVDGDTTKRVIFEKEFDFGLENEYIPLNNSKNYSVVLSTNDNIQAYISDQRTTGFKINVEQARGFSGNVYWTATEYEKTEVEEKLVDISAISSNSLIEDYSVILQPSYNTNVWASDLSLSGFKICSRYSFVGFVDYLIISQNSSQDVVYPVLVGEQIFSKGQDRKEIQFERPMLNTDYSLFLTPSSNTRTWWENKTVDGFTLVVERDTDFSGIVQWQLYISTFSGSIKFGGGNNTYGEPEIKFVDLNETTYLDYIVQGIPKISLIKEDGLINTLVNGLQLTYNTDITINPGISFEIDDDTISYNNIRVLVKTGETWVEWTEIKNVSTAITSNSNVFDVRINKDKKIGIKFGNNDYFGKNPLGSQIAIIGMQCVGVEGNINNNTLSESVITSLNFNTNNIVTTEIAVELLDMLKINKESFFNGTNYPLLVDYSGTQITTDVFTVLQLDSGILGTEVENVESIRKNVTIYKNTQDRFVTSDDYKSIIISSLPDMVLQLEVFNYAEAKDLNLIPVENANYFYNTLFFMMVPHVGTSFTLLQKDFIKKFLDNNSKKITGVDTVILSPMFVPIDVAISYTTRKNSSLIEARNAINNGVYDFFIRKNRSLGETINADDIRNNIDKKNITSLSVMIKEDKKNEFLPGDYNVSISAESYKDKYEDTEKQKLEAQVKKQLRNLIDKGLVQLSQPLFDIEDTSGKRNWTFSGDINLGRFEFPVLGDLIIERKS
jgi:hypothetical protein